MSNNNGRLSSISITTDMNGYGQGTTFVEIILRADNVEHDIECNQADGTSQPFRP